MVLAQTEGDESKRPSGIMVNAEGDFVIAEPDKASWEQFQAKAKSTSDNKAARAEDQEVEERGLQCSIDKKMFIEPMKTPCCKKTFCNDCITNALIESDFICPACQTEGVLLDDIQPDDEASKKIQEYLKEKEAAKSPPLQSPKPNASENVVKDREGDPERKEEEMEKVKSPQPDTSEDKETLKSPTPQFAAIVKSPSTQERGQDEPEESQAELDSKPQVTNTKKRPADELLENPKIPKGPRAMQNQQAMNNMNNMNGMPNMGMNNMMFNGMPMMPNMMGMPNMNVGMGMMGMPMMGMPNMPNMPDFGGMNQGFGSMNGGWDMSGMSGTGGMSGFNGMQGNMGMTGNIGPNMGAGMNGFQNGGGNFTQNGNEDDAYFRKPVNPQRHQNKQRRVRPSDYREL